MSEVETRKSNGPAFNTWPAGLEKWLANFYTKTITLNLPAGGRKWLADNVWWIALVGGLLSLISAWNVWQLTQYADGMANWANKLSAAYGSTALASETGFAWYVVLGLIVVEAVLLLAAVGKLKNHQKSGWNLLFYLSLVSVVMGIIYLFVPYYGFGSLIGTAIGALIGWFFLFQIRSHFKS